MPMDPTGVALAAKINQELIASGVQASLPLDPRAVLAIAKAVVDYIQTDAIVTGAVTVVSVAGVTTGPGISGPGVGTMAAGKVL